MEAGKSADHNVGSVLPSMSDAMRCANCYAVGSQKCGHPVCLSV